MQIRSEKGNLTPTPSVTSKPLSWYVFDICFMNTVHGGRDGVWCGDVAKSYKLLWHLLQKFCKMGFWGSSGCLCTVVHCGFFSKHYRTGFVHPFPRWGVCVFMVCVVICGFNIIYWAFGWCSGLSVFAFHFLRLSREFPARRAFCIFLPRVAVTLAMPW